MTLATKITSLQNFLNSTYSSFVTTLGTAYNQEYANSVISAIRLLGKQSRISIKSLWLGADATKRYYDILPSSYTKDAVDFIKVHSISVVTPTTTVGGLTTVVITDQQLTTIEDLEGKTLDSTKLAQKFVQTSSGFKINQALTGATNTIRCLGAPIGSTSSTDTIKILKTNIIGTPLANDLIYNLDKTDTNLSYCADTIKSVADGSTTWDITLNHNVVSAPYSWVATDRCCVSLGASQFFNVTIQCIPQLTYFTATSDTVPVLPQFEDDIDDLCYKYLFKILGMRDPEKMNIYVGLVKSGLIRSEYQVIRDVKIRSTTADLTVAGNYSPISNQYGR